MISRARPLCVLMNAISSSDSPASAPPRSSNSAVPRIAWSGLFSSCATPETSTPIRCERPLLPHHLTLQRLQRLAHLALLFDLVIAARRAYHARLAAIVVNAA